METCNFDNVNGNFAKLSNFIAVFQGFNGNFDCNLGKCEELNLHGVRGGRELANLLKYHSKNQCKPIFRKFASIPSDFL